MLNFVEKKRIFKNLKSYFFVFFSKISSQIVFIPLMFYFWGVETTGIWLFLASSINSINVLNINVSEYSFQKVILSDKSNLNKLYSNSLIITLLNAIFLSILIFLIFFFFLQSLDIFKNYNKEDLFVIFICLTFAFVFLNITKFLYIHFYFEGKLYFNNYNQEVIDLFYKIILPFSGFYFTDLKILGYLYLALIFFNFIFILTIINKKKIFIFKIKLLKFDKIKENLIGSLNYNYINLINIFNTSLLNILIGIFYNAETLALTNALINLFKNTINRFISIGNEILMYEIPSQIKDKKKNLAMNFRNFHNRFSFLLIIIYISFSYLFGKIIFNFWTLNKFNNYDFLMWAVIFESITFIFMNNFLNIFKSLNKLEGLSIKILFITVISYLLIYIFNHKYLFIESIFIILSVRNILSYCILKFFYNKKLQF